MTIIFADPIFEQHRTGYHPESPKRISESLHRLASRPWYQDLVKGRFDAVSEERLLRTHDAQVIDRLKAACAAGGGHLDSDTFVSPESLETSKLAAGAAIAACEQVISGSSANAFCLLRPPGHHANREASRGFCVFNNVAVAAHYALDVHSLHRILIIDFDVHHGDGTQAIFYEDPAVDYLSIHRYPFYPGTGHQSETGSGQALGGTHNLPIAYGSSREKYLESFQKGLETALKHSKPELILLSAGFDAHKADPVGSLDLEYEDFITITRWIKEAAEIYAKGRLVSLLEGGYNLDTLPVLVEDHIRVLSGN